MQKRTIPQPDQQSLLLTNPARRHSPFPAAIPTAFGLILALFASLLLTACDDPAGTTAASAPLDTPAPPQPEDFPQAEFPQSHNRMVAVLNAIADHTVLYHPYHGSNYTDETRRRLEALPPNTSIERRWKYLYETGIAEIKLDRLKDGIEHLQKAYALIENTPSENKAETLFQLGVAYMRLGETNNCCATSTSQGCILPLVGPAIHSNTLGSLTAINYLTAVVESTDPSTVVSLNSRWLLNIAYMTLGRYPHDVPAHLLIPPTTFARESDNSIPRFKNVAPELGVDTFSLAGGAVADNLNQDGHIDLMVSTWKADGPIRVFINKGDGTFDDRSSTSGLQGITGGLNMQAADYDNDGDLDVLVLRGAWSGSFVYHPNSLLRNNGDGTFVDVTFEAGLGDAWLPTQTASWADFDLDGDLDLYIGNETSDTIDAPNQLFVNNGDGTFKDIANAAGLTNDRYTKAVTWGDYDNDRYPDIYVSNLHQPNRLYHNNQDGTFTDVSESLGVDRPLTSFPAWFWDFNNDGRLDIFVSTYNANMAIQAALAIGYDVPFEPPGHFIAQPDGTFANLAQQHGINYPMLTMGSNFGDINNDGYPDAYLGTGAPEFHNITPNVMLLNKSGNAMADISVASGFAHLQKGHAIVLADFDGDNDVDIFEQMGGAFLADRAYDALYRNPGGMGHSLTVRLVGTTSNRSAIGARIHAVITENGQQRSVYRHVNTGGTFGNNPLRQTLGTATATTIDTIEIYWPVTDITQTFHNVSTDRQITITEGSDAIIEFQPQPTQTQPKTN